MKDICPQCGREFELNANQRSIRKKQADKPMFCSRQCSGTYYAVKQHREETAEQKQLKYEKVSSTLKAKYPAKPKPEVKKRVVEHIFRNCAYCGTEFELTRHQKARLRENPNAVFCCNNICSNRLKARNNIGRKREGSISSQEISAKCAYCGNEFKLNRAQKQKYNKDQTITLYCSVGCRNRANAKKNTQQRPEVACAYCGNKFTLSSDQLTEYNKGQTEFYCSRSCVARKTIPNMDFEARNKKFKKLYQDPEWLAKRNKIIKQRTRELYGADNIFQVEEFKEKAKHTKLTKYGDSNYNNRVKAAQTYYENYGDTGKALNKISNINKNFAKIFNIDTFEYPINGYSFDLKKGNTLIEIDPTFTHHSSGKALRGKFTGVAENYHLMKSNLAKDYGFECIHIFDWDNVEKINYLLQDKITLYARNLYLVELTIEETTQFLDKFHLQNSCSGQEIRLGLVDESNNLIQIMTFGEPRYNKNYEWELLRLCTRAEYKVVGGAEKLLKAFKELYSPVSIISYCDYSKFSGNVYERLGFKLAGKPTPSKHWSKDSKHITDNLLRQRGYDQLFGTNYGKGTSNEELMLDNGWLPVYDCGQATYVWKQEQIQ